MQTLQPQTNISLWRADFWRMGTANLLLSTAMYMLFPILPSWLLGRNGVISLVLIGATIAVFGLGLFIFGPVYSHMADKYRRNSICILSIFAIIACTAGINFALSLALLALLRFVQGAFFGLAQMSLGSTLVLDLTDTRCRTEAGYAYTWFGRIAIGLGPLAGILINQIYGIQDVLITSVVLSFIAIAMLMQVKVPFRAPLQPKVFSFDRFWLPQGKWLFATFLPIPVCIGMFFSVNLSLEFYLSLTGGLILAIIVQRVVFARADLKSEVSTGFVLMIAAMLLQITHNPALVTYGVSILLGLGLGLTASQYLLYFIKISEHCQRSTAQTSYMLSWEFGICLGFFIGLCMIQHLTYIYYAALGLFVLDLILYNRFIYSWVMNHRLR